MASLPATSPGPGVARPSAGVHRTPAHIHQIGAGVSLERLYTLVPHVHLPVSLDRPGSSGSADPSRRCQGCSHPPRRLPGRAALSFPSLLRQTRDGVLSPPSGNAAPRGARSPRSRLWTARTYIRDSFFAGREFTSLVQMQAEALRSGPPRSTGLTSTAVWMARAQRRCSPRSRPVR